MSILDELGDIDNLDPNQVERDVEGKLVPPGKYLVRLEATKPVTANSGMPGQEFEFRIIAGDHKGLAVKDTLWVSDKTKARLAMYSHRLGLLEKVTVDGVDKYARIPGKDHFEDVIGNEVVIEVVHEEYTNGKGQKGIAAKITYGGVYRTNDPKVADVISGQSSTAALPGNAKTPPAKKGPAKKSPPPPPPPPQTSTFDDL